MRLTIIFISLVPVLFSGCKSKQINQKEKWIELFNGRDLDDWQVKIRGYDLNDNYANTFSIKDGMITVNYDGYETFDNRFGHIFYNQPFSRYRLRVEYRFMGDQANGGAGWAFRNSGIMFHAQAPETMLKDQDFPISLEAQFLGGNGSDPRSTMNLCTPGTHVDMDGTQVTDHCINSDSETFHGDQWVVAEIEVYSNELIRHLVNGVEVMRYTNPVIGGGVVNGFDETMKKERKSLEGGYIALQSESHPIQFRKVELLKL